MTATLNPAPDHLPAFIASPDGTDVFMTVMAVVLVIAVVAIGLLFLRIPRSMLSWWQRRLKSRPPKVRS